MTKPLKTLCSSCVSGLVLEEDCGAEDCKERHFKSKCTFGWGDTYVEAVIACNQYKKGTNKVTYYDPDFDEYAAKVEAGNEPEVVGHMLGHDLVEVGK